jgi:hypothetical protein
MATASRLCILNGFNYRKSQGYGILVTHSIKELWACFPQGRGGGGCGSVELQE